MKFAQNDGIKGAYVQQDVTSDAYMPNTGINGVFMPQTGINEAFVQQNNFNDMPQHQPYYHNPDYLPHHPDIDRFIGNILIELKDITLKIENIGANQENILINLVNEYNSNSRGLYYDYAIIYTPCGKNSYAYIRIENIYNTLLHNTDNIRKFINCLYHMRNYGIKINIVNGKRNNNTFNLHMTNNKKKLFVFQIMITSKNSANVWTFLDLFSKKFKNSIYQVNTDRDGRYTCYCEYSEEIVKSIKTLSTAIHEKIQTEVI